MALVTVDGGNGYWHPHPDDDPMGMIIHELIPMMQRRGLGVRPGSIGAMGISMGGYGAIALAQHYPHIFRAVAAISPAIFASYDWVHYVNPGAYWGPADFAKYDAITHVSALRHTPVRVASGDHDPFHPWVEDFVRRLPASDPVVFPPGEHNGAFFYNQIAPSIEFLAAYLATPLGSQS
jgi:S-formylglutathione hydrolase FrmB